MPSMLEPEGSSKEYRKNWTRLIQKIYEVDPLTCPKCSGKWQVKPRSPPKATSPIKIVEYSIDYSVSQLPASDDCLAEGHVFSVIDPEPAYT